MTRSYIADSLAADLINCKPVIIGEKSPQPSTDTRTDGHHTPQTVSPSHQGLY